jgi:hypothetical protein
MVVATGFLPMIPPISTAVIVSTLKQANGQVPTSGVIIYGRFWDSHLQAPALTNLLSTEQDCSRAYQGSCEKLMSGRPQCGGADYRSTKSSAESSICGFMLVNEKLSERLVVEA